MDARVPWGRPDLFLRLPPEAGPWGIARTEAGKGVRFEEVADASDLRRRLREEGSIQFAWTPGDRHLRPIYEVEEAAAEVEARGAEEARRALRESVPSLLATLGLLAGMVVFWPADRGQQFLFVMVLFFVVLPLWRKGVEGAFEAWRSRRRVQREPARWRVLEASRVRFAAWSGRRHSIAAIALVGAFAVTYLATAWTGQEAAFLKFGLVKDKVRAGEWWRLLSCAFLHGSVMHLFFNAAAGLSLARIARSLVSEVAILGVFLVSAAAGSAASVLLLRAPSIGASGGILGWGGLLLGLALAHRELRPTGLISNLMRWVVLIVLIGVAGMGFIDNAAHAGGLLAGLAAGLWIARNRDRPLPVPAPFPDTVQIAVGVLAGAPWLWMLWLLVRARL